MWSGLWSDCQKCSWTSWRWYCGAQTGLGQSHIPSKNDNEHENKLGTAKIKRKRNLLNELHHSRQFSWSRRGEFPIRSTPSTTHTISGCLFLSRIACCRSALLPENNAVTTSHWNSLWRKKPPRTRFAWTLGVRVRYTPHDTPRGNLTICCCLRSVSRGTTGNSLHDSRTSLLQFISLVVTQQNFGRHAYVAHPVEADSWNTSFFRRILGVYGVCGNVDTQFILFPSQESYAAWKTEVALPSALTSFLCCLCWHTTPRRALRAHPESSWFLLPCVVPPATCDSVLRPSAWLKWKQLPEYHPSW